MSRWADGQKRGRCLVCRSRRIRGAGSGEGEYLHGLDHMVCDACGARYTNSYGWVWVMRRRRSEPHVGIYAKAIEPLLVVGAGARFITVGPDPRTAQFGPFTKGTRTSGIQEVINFASKRPHRRRRK